MSHFEKEYYQSDLFWSDGMVEDSYNKERILNTISLIPNEVKSIVDIGCGNGVFVNMLSTVRPELNIEAVDRSSTALKYVKVKNAEAEIIDLPFDSGSFDCVTCLQVLEHLSIPDFEKAILELTRVSKRYIILSVPNSENLENSYTKCPECKTIFNYQLHLRSFGEEYFANLLQPYGYNSINIQKMGKLVHYRGHRLYTRLFHKEQILAWRSPICPICGFKEDDSSARSDGFLENNQTKKKNVLFSKIKNIWPKEKEYYWLVSVYEKQIL